MLTIHQAILAKMLLLAAILPLVIALPTTNTTSGTSINDLSVRNVTTQLNAEYSCSASFNKACRKGLALFLGLPCFICLKGDQHPEDHVDKDGSSVAEFLRSSTPSGTCPKELVKECIENRSRLTPLLVSICSHCPLKQRHNNNDDDDGDDGDDKHIRIVGKMTAEVADYDSIVKGNATCLPAIIKACPFVPDELKFAKEICHACASRHTQNNTVIADIIDTVA